MRNSVSPRQAKDMLETPDMERLEAADMAAGCPGFTSIQQGRNADGLVYGHFGGNGRVSVEDELP